MSDFVPFFTERSTTTAEPAAFSALTASATVKGPADSADDAEIAPSTAAPALTPTATTDTCAETPRVTLLRENDQVTRIVVECACGRKFELDCVY